MANSANSNDAALLRALDAALCRFIAGAAERSDLGDADRAAIRDIREIARRATEATNQAWAEFLSRVERTWSTSAPAPARSLDRDVSSFLARSEETAPLGSVQLPVIRFGEARKQIAADGEKVLRQIATCIELAEDREQKNRAWWRDRAAFIEELYTREETRDLMRAFDRLEQLTGADFEAGALRPSLIRALAVIVPWCARAGRPFMYADLPVDGHAPLYDFRTMREEWKAIQSKDGGPRRVSEKHVA